MISAIGAALIAKLGVIIAGGVSGIGAAFLNAALSGVKVVVVDKLKSTVKERLHRKPDEPGDEPPVAPVAKK